MFIQSFVTLTWPSSADCLHILSAAVNAEYAVADSRLGTREVHVVVQVWSWHSLISHRHKLGPGTWRAVVNAVLNIRIP